MAQVFRPQYSAPFPPGVKILKRGKKKGKPAARIEWPDGRRETVRTTKDGSRLIRQSPTYWVWIGTPATGGGKKVKLFRDKKASETRAAELERRAERLAAGRVDPADEHAMRPLADHAEDYRRYLAAKGNVPPHVRLVLFRLIAVLDHCRFTKIGDVQPSAVVEFLGTLRSQGKSLKTVNDYLAAVKAFMRWLWRDKRIGIDPLAGMSKLPNGESDLRHARRDFAPEELRLLLDTARTSTKSIRCLTGIDRYFVYLTACATGFRASELAIMTPESFALEGDMPTARCNASCTKNRKIAVQPLPLDVAEALAGYLSGKPAGLPVWPGKWRRKAVYMIRADMAEARRVWLSAFQDARQRAEADQSDFMAYCDSQGRFADFHALRHSYITMIGKTGVSPREHQDLARHSTYALTSRYSHSRFYDLAAAVQALPIPMGTPGPEAPALAATGTDCAPGKSLLEIPWKTQRQTAHFDGPSRTETTIKKSDGTTEKTATSATFPVISAMGDAAAKKWAVQGSNL